MSVEHAIGPMTAHPLTGWYAKAALTIGADRLALLGTFPGLCDGDYVDVESPTVRITVRARTHAVPQGTIAVLPLEKAASQRALHVRSTETTAGATVPTVDGDIGVLLRSGVAALPAEERGSLLAFLIDACGRGRDTLPARLVDDLQLLRDTLREPRAEPVIDSSGHRAAKVEVLARVDANAFYIRGWIGHEDRALPGLRVVSPEGVTVDLTGRIARFSRDDVAQFYGEDEDSVGYGFAAFFTVDMPSTTDTGWLLEVSPFGESPMDAPAPRLTSGHLTVRDLLIADLAVERLPRDRLRRDHLKPAITRLQDNARGRVRVSLVRQFGDPPPSPEVTVIVPLYRRIDLVEHQLAQFVHDPELAATDLLYVLDSPEQRDALLAEARRLFRLYRVPFRVAILSQNGGYSTANNIGARLARGRQLLLLNSDVIPDRPGWLGGLTRFYGSVPDAGAIGPKLLYEDNSIQHAGMYFAHPFDSDEWTNEHYFKGLHRSFPPACVTRPVPAVTAACMLIDKDLFHSVGGFHGAYVQGDFEDSDLCLRLRAEGRQHWYVAHVELFHLEGQSYPTPMRVLNGAFNRWMHSHQWGGLIEQVMTDQNPFDMQEV